MGGDVLQQLPHVMRDTIFVQALPHRNILESLSSILSTFFSALSAGAALLAVKYAAAAITDQKAARELSRRQELYRRLVLDVGLQLVPAFARRVTGLLRDGAARLASDRSGMLHDMVMQSTRELVQEFKVEFYELRIVLRSTISAWEDPQVWRLVGKELEDMEDEVVAGIRRLAAEEAGEPIQQTVADSTARLLHIIVSQDVR